MKLEVATLVAGSESPAGDGISGALRCVLKLPDKTRRAAVLKRVAMEEVLAEAFSALLLRAWQLPVPEPFLVDEAGTISFASSDVGYPSLKQSLGVTGLPAGPVRDAVVALAKSIATSLPTSPLAAACDEAIDNRDRNLGNILWDGRDEVWIDHALALGRGGHLADQNLLCSMVLGTTDQDRFCRAALSQGLLLDRAVPGTVDAAVAGSLGANTSLAPLVSLRLVGLGARLLARFPSAGDLLSMP